MTMGADHKYRTVHAVVLEISPYLICDNFPKFLLLYFSQLLKIQLRILPGVWGRSHQVILSLAVKTGRFWLAGDMIFWVL